MRLLSYFLLSFPLLTAALPSSSLTSRDDGLLKCASRDPRTINKQKKWAYTTEKNFLNKMTEFCTKFKDGHQLPYQLVLGNNTWEGAMFEVQGPNGTKMAQDECETGFKKIIDGCKYAEGKDLTGFDYSNWRNGGTFTSGKNTFTLAPYSYNTLRITDGTHPYTYCHTWMNGNDERVILEGSGWRSDIDVKGIWGGVHDNLNGGAIGSSFVSSLTKKPEEDDAEWQIIMDVSPVGAMYLAWAKSGWYKWMERAGAGSGWGCERTDPPYTPSSGYSGGFGGCKGKC